MAPPNFVERVPSILAILSPQDPGISVAIASQLTAAGLEYSRRSANVLPIPSNCAPLGPDGHVRMSAMSAFWMVLPYALVGIGGQVKESLLWLDFCGMGKCFNIESIEAIYTKSKALIKNM